MKSYEDEKFFSPDKINNEGNNNESIIDFQENTCKNSRFFSNKIIACNTSFRVLNYCYWEVKAAQVAAAAAVVAASDLPASSEAFSPGAPNLCDRYSKLLSAA